MALQMIHLFWYKIVMMSLHPFSPARTLCGWSERHIWQLYTFNNVKKTHFRFHSDPYGNTKGFQIEYNTIEQFTTCGGTYSNASGVLSSPLHPNSYPKPTNCVYIISQPDGMYINISFLSMDIDCQGAPSDYIEIRDGNSEESPLMGIFCGNGSNAPAFLQTTQNYMRIRWRKYWDIH